MYARRERPLAKEPGEAASGGRLRCRVLDERDQVGEVLRGEALFEAFGHQGKLGGAEGFYFGAGDRLAQAVGLDERDRGGGFVGQEADLRVAVVGVDLVGDEAAFDGGVGIDDGGEQVGGGL